MWNSYFGFVITFVAIFTLVPYFTSLITSWLGHLSKIILVDNLGNNSQLVVGGLGVIIHELGHAIFAYLFGHKVIKCWEIFSLAWLRITCVRWRCLYYKNIC